MAKIKHITDKHGEIVYPISKEGAIYDDNGVLLSSKISTFITRLVDNLANYYLKSETYTKGEVDSMISAIQGFTCIVVPELPTASAETMGAIYLVPSEDPQTQNVKDEYITIRSGVEGSYTYSWEQIGSTAIDLSGYVTTEDLNEELAKYTTTANLTTLLAGKQDTIADLASIRSGASLGATAYQKPNSGIPASDIAAGVIPDISGKQDVIPDLSTIRSGAAAGATAYQKPGTGIPATDMASGVQTSLGKADSAYQKPSGGIPKTDLESGVQDSLDLADSAVQADPVGSVTPPVTPSDWATAEQVEELEAEVVGVTKNYGVGYYYYSNGIVDPNQTNWFHGEDYIPVNEGDEVVWNPGGTGNGNSGLCRYNANKEFLASWIGNAVERTVTIPAGVSFIRGSFMVSNFNNAKIIVNGATVWTPHDAQTGMKDTLSKVEDISNYVKSTFSVTPGTAHSSMSDALVIEIKNGESFNVFFIETEKVTKGYVYVHYVGGSGTTLIDEILPCQSKQFTASADIDYIGIYLDGGAIKQSGDITFFACLASGLGDLLSSEMNTLKSVVEDNKTAVTETNLRENNFNSVYNSTDIAEKCKDYSALFNNSGKCESIVFMTDPHLMGSSNTFNETTFKNYIGILQKYYNMLPIDWLVCGGDWLNNGDYQDGACWKLGYVDATMRKLFGNRYYPMLGNHDTNYQGVVSSDDSSRGDLTHQTLVNLMFRDNGNTFYEWKGNNTRFFVLDTGLDWNETMDSYRWEQVAWLANNLLANEDEHLVILMHIYYNSGTTPSVLAPVIQTLCGAFNGRTSVTLNGNTYDFTNANGTIHCIISGHSHADYIIEENVNVPVWLTANMEKGGNPTFDLLLIDYTAGKMKSIRVGTGNDREMNLA